MSLLSYNKLRELVGANIINANIGNINGASIDITLGNEILIEKLSSTYTPVDLKNKESLELISKELPEDGFLLRPGEFILATSVEKFNLPRNVACEYKLKSSLARCGLQHMLAGWCDPGWTDSKLTLELKNVTQNHVLLLRSGMKIGQMVFFECDTVPEEHSYSTTGQYNRQTTVTESGGLR